MHEAKSQLSKLGELAWSGEKIVIAKAGKPYLDLVPHKEDMPVRKPGRLKGQITLAEDFDAVDHQIAVDFEGAPADSPEGSVGVQDGV